MPKLSKQAMIGYPAGIITGVTYGLNPLFAMPLMADGASIEAILFFRYGLSVLLLGLFIWLTKQSFRLTFKQMGILLMLGLLYTGSTSVLGVFEPITAILVGTLFLGEALTSNIVVGIVISMAAVTFMIISTKR